MTEAQTTSTAAEPRFEFDGSEGSLTEYLAANADDEPLCEWLRQAVVGESFAGCTRIA